MKAIVTAYLTRATRNGSLIVPTEIRVNEESVDKAKAAVKSFLDMRSRNRNYIPATHFKVQIISCRGIVKEEYTVNSQPVENVTNYRVVVNTPEGVLVAEETLQTKQWNMAAFLAARMNRNNSLFNGYTCAVCTVCIAETNEVAGQESIAIR